MVGQGLSRIEVNLSEDLATFSRSHQTLTRLYRRLVARRVEFLILLAVAIGTAMAIPDFATGDLRLFATAGEDLLRGRSDRVFADPAVQVGPIQLIPFGLASYASRITGLPLRGLVTIPVAVSLVISWLAVLRRIADRGPKTATAGSETFLGILILLGGFTFEAATSSHPAEAFIPLAWILAATYSREGHSTKAGILIGLAAGMKAWGLLGLPLLLLGHGWARMTRGAVAALSISALAYLPLLIGTDTGTIDFTWEVKAHSPLTFFLPEGSTFGWDLRILQGAFVVGIGGVAVLFLREHPGALWIAPLTLISLRLLSDPLDYHYYWLPVGLVALLGWSSRGGADAILQRVIAAPSFYITLVPFYIWSGHLLRAWIVVSACSIMAFVLMQIRVSKKSARLLVGT